MAASIDDEIQLRAHPGREARELQVTTLAFPISPGGTFISATEVIADRGRFEGLSVGPRNRRMTLSSNSRLRRANCLGELGSDQNILEFGTLPILEMHHLPASHLPSDEITRSQGSVQYSTIKPVNRDRPGFKVRYPQGTVLGGTSRGAAAPNSTAMAGCISLGICPALPRALNLFK